MPIDPDRNAGSDRFQFKLRTLLIIVTVACVLFGLLAFLLPNSLSIQFRAIIYVSYTAALALAIWSIYRSKRDPWKTPTEYVMVKVDAKWKRRIESPLIFGPIAALTGVSLTFAPLFLLWSGPIEKFGVVQWITVPLCFLIIYLVPGFYMRLAAEVMAELRKAETPASDSPSSA
jgi:hypothetical protein